MGFAMQLHAQVSLCPVAPLPKGTQVGKAGSWTIERILWRFLMFYFSRYVMCSCSLKFEPNIEDMGLANHDLIRMAIANSHNRNSFYTE